jgi:nicotinamidase-related amidase
VIGEQGKMGRLLVRGEYGHDIVDELKPLPGEVVIDKPGKGSFWNTTIVHKLKARAITHLIVSGVTTECCFATSIREANDRGFECCKCLCFKPPTIQLSTAPNLFCFTLTLITSNNLSATKLMNLIEFDISWLSMQNGSDIISLDYVC